MKAQVTPGGGGVAIEDGPTIRLNEDNAFLVRRGRDMWYHINVLADLVNEKAYLEGTPYRVFFENGTYWIELERS